MVPKIDILETLLNYKSLGIIWPPFIVLFVFVLPFFYDPVFSYFSQDDFYHLRTIMGKSVADIPSFFVTWQEGQTFYRPLSREVFNLLMYKIFGLNPLPFHIVNLLLIYFIAILTFILIKRTTAIISAAILGVFIYFFNAAHGVELYYLASVQTLFSTVFLLLSLLNFLSFLEKNKIKNFSVSLLFFVMSLLSHGMAVAFPGILIFMSLWKRSFLRFVKLKNVFVILLPFIIIDLIFISLSSLFNLPSQQVYQPTISLKTMLNTAFWYTVWTLGLPEMLVDFVGPGFQINPNLMRWYGDYFKIVLPLLTFFVLSLVLIFYNIKKRVNFSSPALFFIGSFFISLSPFLIFPQHKFVSYLSFAVVWFSSLGGYLLGVLWNQKSRRIWGKTVVVLATICLLIVSWYTTHLNEKTHWAAKRAAAAKYLLDDIKKQYPNIGKGTIFYFTNNPDYPTIAKDWGASSKQAFYILSGADSLKLLYNDSTVKAYFEEVNPLPGNVDKKMVIEYVAKFPY